MCRLLQQFESLPLAFGGAAISGEGGGYGFGDISEQESLSLIQHAFDRGVRVFDSAPIYGFGLSERRLGKALRSKREEAFLISKSGVTWHENKRVNMTNDAGSTLKMLEQSLRDLNTEYIDLYMIHWPDEKVDIRRPLEVLAKARSEGKIKHIGLCNTYLEDLEKAQEIDHIHVVQSQLNFFEREVVERLLPSLEEKKISFMSWGTFDKGVLTGRVSKENHFDKSDCRSWAPWWKAEKEKREKKYAQVEKLKNLTLEAGYTIVQLAIASNLYAHKVVDMPICGMRTREQVDKTVEAFSHLPSREEVKKWSAELL